MLRSRTGILLHLRDYTVDSGSNASSGDSTSNPSDSTGTPGDSTANSGIDTSAHTYTDSADSSPHSGSDFETTRLTQAQPQFLECQQHPFRLQSPR
eukprot:UN16735